MSKLGLYFSLFAVLGLVALFVIPLAQAQAPGQPNRATLRCHNLPAGITATVTWYWTVRGTPVTPSFIMSCTGNGSASTGTPGNPADPGRPAQATDYHRTLSFSNAGGPVGTPCSTSQTVTPGFAFSDRAHCDPSHISAGFSLQTP